MANSALWAGVVGGFLATLCTTVGRAEEGQQPPPAFDTQAIEQMMAEYAKLGPEHERFKQVVGKWKTETKSFCKDPQNPEVSEGTAVFTLLMDGRFLVQRFHGVFDGKPFEGMGLCGFDRVKKKHTGIWIDNMGTGIMHSEGTLDEASGTMTDIGEMASPIGPMRMKMVTKPIDNDKFLFTMVVLLPDGSENKGMEILYTRQPAGI